MLTKPRRAVAGSGRARPKSTAVSKSPKAPNQKQESLWRVVWGTGAMTGARVAGALRLAVPASANREQADRSAEA